MNKLFLICGLVSTIGTSAFASTATRSFLGAFENVDSLQQGLDDIYQDGANTFCPNGGTWTGTHGQFQYWRNDPVIGTTTYTATNVPITVVCDWSTKTWSFNNGAFENVEGSNIVGQEDVCADLQAKVCPGKPYSCTFNPYQYWRNDPFIGPTTYTATGLTGTITCTL